MNSTSSLVLCFRGQVPGTCRWFGGGVAVGELPRGPSCVSQARPGGLGPRLGCGAARACGVCGRVSVCVSGLAVTGLPCGLSYSQTKILSLGFVTAPGAPIARRPHPCAAAAPHDRPDRNRVITIAIRVRRSYGEAFDMTDASRQSDYNRYRYRSYGEAFDMRDASRQSDIARYHDAHAD